MTRSAYVQVRCAVVALWSERHQRYAAKTGPERQTNEISRGPSLGGFGQQRPAGQHSVKLVPLGRGLCQDRAPAGSPVTDC